MFKPMSNIPAQSSTGSKNSRWCAVATDAIAPLKTPTHNVAGMLHVSKREEDITINQTMTLKLAAESNDKYITLAVIFLEPKFKTRGAAGSNAPKQTGQCVDRRSDSGQRDRQLSKHCLWIHF